MASEKKGFVLYFDSYDAIEEIEASQRGELLSALFRYAYAVRQQDIKPSVFVQSCDTLDNDTRMAFCFLAGNIRRDTAKWQTSRENYRAGALKNVAQRAEKQEVSSRAESMKKYI